MPPLESHSHGIYLFSSHNVRGLSDNFDNLFPSAYYFHPSSCNSNFRTLYSLKKHSQIFRGQRQDDTEQDHRRLERPPMQIEPQAPPPSLPLLISIFHPLSAIRHPGCSQNSGDEAVFRTSRRKMKTVPACPCWFMGPCASSMHRWVTIQFYTFASKVIWNENNSHNHSF